MKILISISQISRYFESLSRRFFISREESVLYLDNLKKFELLKIVLSFFIENEDDLDRYKIIEILGDEKAIDTNTSSLSNNA